MERINYTGLKVARYWRNTGYFRLYKWLVLYIIIYGYILCPAKNKTILE